MSVGLLRIKFKREPVNTDGLGCRLFGLWSGLHLMPALAIPLRYPCSILILSTLIVLSFPQVQGLRCRV